MADYNIYIRSTEIAGGANASPTTPWAQQSQVSQTTPWGQESSGGSGFSSALGGAAAITKMNPEMIASSTISNAASSIPAIAVAAMIVKVVEKVGNTLYTYATDYIALRYGDYRRKVHLENTKQAIQNVRNPISMITTAVKTQLQWNVENNQRQLERELLGDSVINSYTNRGI